MALSLPGALKLQPQGSRSVSCIPSSFPGELHFLILQRAWRPSFLYPISSFQADSGRDSGSDFRRAGNGPCRSMWVGGQTEMRGMSRYVSSLPGPPRVLVSRPNTLRVVDLRSLKSPFLGPVNHGQYQGRSVGSCAEHTPTPLASGREGTEQRRWVWPD